MLTSASEGLTIVGESGMLRIGTILFAEDVEAVGREVKATARKANNEHCCLQSASPPDAFVPNLS